MIHALWGSSKTPELNAYFARWAAARTPNCRNGFGNCMTMGVFDGWTLIAVMVYHHWDEQAGVIEISGAAEDSRWLTRSVLRDMFKYPFTDCGCQLVAMRVSEKNKRLARMLAAYGFTCYKLPRLRGRHEDENVFLLTDDDWRTNKFTKGSSDGKVLQRADAA